MYRASHVPWELPQLQERLCHHRFMTWGKVTLVTVALAVIGSHAAVPAAAVPAAPSSLVVDCGLANGVTATTITGRSGDTFTIDNTSGTGKCRFGTYAGVVSATNLDVNDDLAAGSISTLTILSAGTFVVTPQGGGGTATTLTVVLGNPVAVPEYTITFDANGGTCSSNPLTITALSGEW